MDKTEWTAKFHQTLKSKTGLDLEDVPEDILDSFYRNNEPPEAAVNYVMGKYELNDISGV